MCIHYLLAGVSVIDEQPTSSTTIQAENDQALQNKDAPSTSATTGIIQERGTDSKEILENKEDTERQATPRGSVNDDIFVIFIKCENFLRFPRSYAWVLFAF